MDKLKYSDTTISWFSTPNFPPIQFWISMTQLYLNIRFPPKVFLNLVTKSDVPQINTKRGFHCKWLAFKAIFSSQQLTITQITDLRVLLFQFLAYFVSRHRPWQWLWQFSKNACSRVFQTSQIITLQNGEKPHRFWCNNWTAWYWMKQSHNARLLLNPQFFKVHTQIKHIYHNYNINMLHHK
jgi:hypothetical protein